MTGDTRERVKLTVEQFTEICENRDDASMICGWHIDVLNGRTFVYASEKYSFTYPVSKRVAAILRRG